MEMEFPMALKLCPKCYLLLLMKARLRYNGYGFEVSYLSESSFIDQESAIFISCIFRPLK